MFYTDIANNTNTTDDTQIDGEDYAIALDNLENKYGYDEDIATLIKMCNQWQNSFHKMEIRYNRLVAAITSFEIKADSIIRTDSMIEE